MKIIYVFHHTGGLQTYVERLLLQLKKIQSIELTLITMDLTTISSNQEISVTKSRHEYGYDLYQLKNIPLNQENPMFNYRNEAAENVLYELVDNIKPDIVHFQTMGSIPIGVCYGLYLQGIKTVLTLHDSYIICLAGNNLVKKNGDVCFGPNGGSSCYKCFENDSMHNSILRYNYVIDTVNKYTDAIIAVSEYIKNLHQINGITKPIEVIRTGFEADSVSDRKIINEKLNLLFSGPLRHQKGVLILLDALRGIDASKYKLHIYGDGSEAFYRTVLKNNYPDINFEYHGRFSQEEKNSVYDSNDLLIMPSIGSEAAPMIQLEAYARRVPSIISSTGGIAEYAQTDGTVIFESGNIGQLHNILNDLIENPEKVQKMSDSITLQNLHSLESMACDYVAFYEKVLAVERVSFQKTHKDYRKIGLSKEIELTTEGIIKSVMLENNKKLQGADFYILGTGVASKFVLESYEGGNLLGFLDNNTSLHGKKLNGYDILPPFYKEGVKILIASMWANEISEQLREIGYKNDDILRIF